MKKYLLLAFTMCFYTSWAINNSDDDDEMVGEVLNKACQQQSISQEITKAYLAILSQLDADNQQKQLNADVLLFEKNQREIPLLLPSKSVGDALRQVDHQWNDFKALAIAPVSKENAVRLLEKNSELLRLTGVLVSQVKNYGRRFIQDEKSNQSYQNVTQLIVVSGSQRLLSQRVVAYGLAALLKLDVPALSDSLAVAQQRLGKSLQTLEQAVENTPEIDYTMVRMAGDWKRLQGICENIDRLSFKDLQEFITIGDDMSNGMNTVSSLYESMMDTELTSLILSNIVNKAGKLRMLSQQVGKAYVAVAMNVDAKTHETQLKNAIAGFNENVRVLREFNSIEGMESAITTVWALWTDYEKIAKEKPSQDGAVLILEKNTPLLQACEAIMTVLQTHIQTLGSKSAKFNREFNQLINKSGRQRMLSQRVALYCMAATWNLNVLDINDQLNEANQQYAASLDALLQMPQNTTEITTKLNEVLTNWTKIQQMCEKSSVTDEEQRAAMLSQSHVLLTEMDAITGLYENLVANMMDTEAMNKAGRQRMLSQRIPQHYIALLMKVDVEAHQKQLAKDRQLFESQLTELLAFNNNKEMKTSLNAAADIWSKYETILDQTPNEAGLKELLALNNDLLRHCENAVAALEKANPTTAKANALINLSGRQRMYSQRIATYYLAYIHSGKQNSDYRQTAIQAIDDFGKGLTYFSSLKTNNAYVQTKLAAIQWQWDKLNRYKAQLDEPDFYQIWLITDFLLAESEALTKAYEIMLVQ